MEKYLKNQIIQLYKEDELKTEIVIKDGKITSKKYDNSLNGQLFLSDNITPLYLKSIFESRIFSKKRSDLPRLLNVLDIEKYDAYDIIKKTHGISSADRFWFKFDNENIKYDDVRIRNV